ncbi:uncharacterized protein LOC136080575 isoform X2 [Hydra vulgaris]|uniref:Uncharacterized protein LOC136080575 isoform X2 n=1 Tax=Hydra vulgaris TaxID=6087 RepID=A0ABM4BWB1_HYDVU
MDVGDFQYTVIKLLTKQLENHNTIHQQRETTVAGMNLSNLPAKFLQVDKLLDFEKIARLSKTGGITLKENIKNILESLMSQKVMACFNMKGTNRHERKSNTQNKFSFEKLKVYELIVASVMMKKTESTVTDIKAEVQKIVRYAPSKLVVEKGGHLHKDSI